MITIEFRGDTYPRDAELVIRNEDGELADGLDLLSQFDATDSDLYRSFIEAEPDSEGVYRIPLTKTASEGGLLADLAGAAEWFDVEEALEKETSDHLAHIEGGDAPSPGDD